MSEYDGLRQQLPPNGQPNTNGHPGEEQELKSFANALFSYDDGKPTRQQAIDNAANENGWLANLFDQRD